MLAGVRWTDIGEKGIAFASCNSLNSLYRTIKLKHWNSKIWMVWIPANDCSFIQLHCRWFIFGDILSSISSTFTWLSYSEQNQKKRPELKCIMHSSLNEAISKIKSRPLLNSYWKSNLYGFSICVRFDAKYVCRKMYAGNGISINSVQFKQRK